MCCCFPNKAGGTDLPVCPACERGKLSPETPLSARRCDRCGDALEGDVLVTLRQIIALPNTPHSRTR